MEATSEAKIPLLHYSTATTKAGDERRLLGDKIREACETYGCFLLTCGDINVHDDEDGGQAVSSDDHRNYHRRMFEFLKTLFDLPEETKLRHQNPKPNRGYISKTSHSPLHETFGGIDDASSPETARMFTDLFWPQGGNPDFCETLHYMSKKMEELSIEVMRMIGESFGLEKRHAERLIKSSPSVLRLMKYHVPCPTLSDHDGIFELGLIAHTDKSVLTALSQNDVQGLQIFTRHNEWARIIVPNNAFLFFVGDALKAWSNGRLVAAKHRVVISRDGDRNRYSFGLFAVPKDEAVIQVPEELVDEEHPLRYRNFKFSDYLSYFVSNKRDDALELFAGV